MNLKEEFLTYWTERYESSCGANTGDGGQGFGKGNTCAGDGSANATPNVGGVSGKEATEKHFSKEGYDSKVYATKAGDIKITDHGAGSYVARKDGKEVGSASLATLHTSDFLSLVKVDKSLRRKGIGTALYDYIEDRLGHPLKASPHDVTEDGQAFRDSRYGKNETKQKGMFGEDFEPGKWTKDELEQLTGEPSKMPQAKEKQAKMFDGMDDDPDQGLMFQDEEKPDTGMLFSAYWGANVERYANSTCGAGTKENPGFEKGNDCAKGGDGGGEQEFKSKKWYNSPRSQDWKAEQAAKNRFKQNPSEENYDKWTEAAQTFEKKWGNPEEWREDRKSTPDSKVGPKEGKASSKPKKEPKPSDNAKLYDELLKNINNWPQEKQDKFWNISKDGSKVEAFLNEMAKELEEPEVPDTDEGFDEQMTDSVQESVDQQEADLQESNGQDPEPKDDPSGKDPNTPPGMTPVENPDSLAKHLMGLAYELGDFDDPSWYFDTARRLTRILGGMAEMKNDLPDFFRPYTKEGRRYKELAKGFKKKSDPRSKGRKVKEKASEPDIPVEPQDSLGEPVEPEQPVDNSQDDTSSLPEPTLEADGYVNPPDNPSPEEKKEVAAKLNEYYKALKSDPDKAKQISDELEKRGYRAKSMVNKALRARAAKERKKEKKQKEYRDSIRKENKERRSKLPLDHKSGSPQVSKPDFEPPEYESTQEIDESDLEAHLQGGSFPQSPGLEEKPEYEEPDPLDEDDLSEYFKKGGFDSPEESDYWSSYETTKADKRLANKTVDPAPRNKLGNAINQYLETNNALAHKLMKDAVGEVHKKRVDEAETVNADIRELLGHAGYVANDTSKFRGKGNKEKGIVGSLGKKTYKSFFNAVKRAGDSDQIPRFDEMVDMVRQDPSSYAGVLQRAGGDGLSGGDDVENAVFDALKKGFVPVPKKTDPEILDEAYDLAGGEDFDKLIAATKRAPVKKKEKAVAAVSPSPTTDYNYDDLPFEAYLWAEVDRYGNFSSEQSVKDIFLSLWFKT
tara:strand:+ start:1054 stop:4104 length:3051 start_codon:yes stop_codon:yes gene_type:complete